MSLDNVLPMSLEYSVTYVPERFIGFSRTHQEVLDVEIRTERRVRHPY
jgi:hypothetical protein